MIRNKKEVKMHLVFQGALKVYSKSVLLKHLGIVYNSSKLVDILEDPYRHLTLKQIDTLAALSNKTPLELIEYIKGRKAVGEKVENWFTKTSVN